MSFSGPNQIMKLKRKYNISWVHVYVCLFENSAVENIWSFSLSGIYIAQRQRTFITGRFNGWLTSDGQHTVTVTGGSKGHSSCSLWTQHLTWVYLSHLAHSQSFQGLRRSTFFFSKEMPIGLILLSQYRGVTWCYCVWFKCVFAKYLL